MCRCGCYSVVFSPEGQPAYKIDSSSVLKYERLFSDKDIGVRVRVKNSGIVGIIIASNSDFVTIRINPNTTRVYPHADLLEVPDDDIP